MFGKAFRKDDSRPVISSQEIAYDPSKQNTKIGDTFSEKELLKFSGVPNFASEHFRRARLKNPLKIKHLQKRLIHLAEEGAVQVFRTGMGINHCREQWPDIEFHTTRDIS